MIRKLTLAAVVAVGMASVANAGLIGEFRKLETGKTTNNLVYPGAFDTWAFDLWSTDSGSYDALSLSFSAGGSQFLNTGSTTFKSGAANPVVFGFEAPDAFIVLPSGAVQLAGSQTDTASNLQADYTTAGALTLVPGGNVHTTVAFFSLPTGGNLAKANFLNGAGVFAGGNPVSITYNDIPEPATLGLLGLALAGCFGCIRRR